MALRWCGAPRRPCWIACFVSSLFLVQPAVATEGMDDFVSVGKGQGGPMVKVPAGAFKMGSDKKDKDALRREKPRRTITLSTFWIDAHEVSNQEYERCVEGKACAKARLKGVDRPGYYARTSAPEQPVVGVTLKDAQDYCRWVGRRLPTEVEWEKAARGTDGRIYPWGNQRPTCKRANYNRCGKVALKSGSKPAGASPYGAHDMAGNVIEWTSTIYNEDFLTKMKKEDPPEPLRGHWRVIRGGSWGSYSNQIRSATRRAWKPDFAGHTIGFRCASSIAPGDVGAR